MAGLQPLLFTFASRSAFGIETCSLCIVALPSAAVQVVEFRWVCVNDAVSDDSIIEAEFSKSSHFAKIL